MSKNRKTKISDFVVARRVLELTCRQHRCSFRDLDIIFDSEVPCFEGTEYGSIHLPESANLTQTIYSIVSVYIDHIHIITGKPMSKDSSDIVKNFALALVRDFATSSDTSLKDNEVHAMKLDQFAFVWIFMKNIVCPYADLPLENFRIIAGSSATVDGAVYVSSDNNHTVNSFNEKYPLVFINLDIESRPVQSAFLLVESIRYLSEESHKDIDPGSLLRSMIFESSLKEKILDFVKMTYPEAEDSADFFATLSILCNSEDLENVALDVANEDKNMVRTAQGGGDNWWFLGLTEKMLEPARSEDWSIYETWKPITQELWDKVEHERRIRGLDQVPFDMLLRIQSEMQTEGYEQTKDKTLQSLLSEDRIW